MARDPRLIAFHLPQYHTIPENDRWWGPGFTEWTNVKRARPAFAGHYQPHEPAHELGYYDMLKPETREMQARLARQAGLSGFCYYHYWFNGKLLLEKPLHDLLEMGRPDFPFCLCWANESWTRAWDGRSGVVLQAQSYSPSDDRAHLRYLKRFFVDPRYIRIEGKPLFIIYRANQLPNARQTTDRLRDEAKKLGLGELFLCRIECYPNKFKTPSEEGFDAAIMFAPDWGNLGKKLEGAPYGDHSVYRYSSAATYMFSKAQPPYKNFPSVFPSWDNHPRRKKGAVILTESNPAIYQDWLAFTLQVVSKRPVAERIVFINAWNEWGEGNHLEPDKRFGNAFIEATRAALEGYDGPDYLRFAPFIHELRQSAVEKTTQLHQRTNELIRAYKDRTERENEFVKAVRSFKNEIARLGGAQ